MRWLLLVAALLGSFAVVFAPTASAAEPCTGVWSIGVGGLQVGLTGTGQDSSYFVVNQRVGYNTLDPQAGLNELDRLFWQHRNACPSDHIMILGHSEGAGIVHAWVSAHTNVPNANAILLADPKRPGGLAGLSGAAFGWPGYPLAGTDANFGNFPVLEVCRNDDVICNVSAGWLGYIQGHHMWYNFDAHAYGTNDRGTLMV